MSDINQLYMFSRALVRARDRLKDDESIHAETRKRAVRVLTELHVRVKSDFKIRQVPFHLGPHETAKLLQVLGSIFPPDAMLTDFAKMPWPLIQAVFDNAQYACPVELREFHVEYQRELENEAAHGDRIPHPTPTLKPGVRRL